jgi:hypothetical protein
VNNSLQGVIQAPPRPSWISPNENPHRLPGTTGKSKGDAIRLAEYLVSPKKGDTDFVIGERLLESPQMGILFAMVPSEFTKESAHAFSLEIGDQLAVWTRRIRGANAMPESLFVHVSLSFHPDDRDIINKDIAMIITNEIINEVMPGNRPMLSVIHGDTQHLHTHFLVGTVDESGRIWNPRFDYRLWEMACERAEKKYKLHRVKFRKACAEKDPERMPLEKSVTGKELQSIVRTGQLTPKAYVQQALRDSLKGEVDFADFVIALEQKGIELLLNVAKTGHISGASYRYDNSTYRGSALGKAYSWKGIAKRTHYDAEKHRETIERLRKQDLERRKKVAGFTMVATTEEPNKRKQKTLELAFEASGNEYLWRSSHRKAFTDHGNKILMESKNRTAIKAALQLAQSKKWASIELFGDDVFRRTAWQLATEMGIEVVGYVPPEGNPGNGSPKEKNQKKGNENEQNRPSKRNTKDHDGGDSGHGNAYTH